MRLHLPHFQLPDPIQSVRLMALLFLYSLTFWGNESKAVQTTVQMTQPMRIIVPNAPGGPTDTVARIVGQRLADSLHISVVIDNRPGASGTVGGDIVAKSQPDGRTLLLVSSSAFVSTPILIPNAPFDGRHAFSLITAVVSVPYVLLVNPTAGFVSVKDLIAQAKTKPGSLNFGSAGNGSTSHLVGALFSETAGFKAQHIAYKGSALAAVDLIGGQLQFEFEAIAGAMQYVKSGRLKALGVSSSKRLETLPDLLTIQEAGLPGFEAVVTHGLCGTVKTPVNMVKYLNQQLTKVIHQPETKQRLESIGAIVLGGTSEEYQHSTRNEISRWEKIVKSLASQEL